MPLESYLESVLRPLLNVPESLTIATSTDDMGVLFTITVDKSDMGLVIGKSGETAKAVRHLMRVFGMKQQARVSVKINEPDGTAYRPERKEVADKELVG